VTLRRAHLYWLCQIGGWSSWTIVGLSYAYVMSGSSLAVLWSSLPTYIASIVSSIGWSHLYRLYIRHRGWAALSPGKLLPRIVPASFALGVVIPYTTVPLYLILYPDRAEVFGMWVLPAVAGTTWCAGIWNVAYFGSHYFERWRQAELDKLQLAVIAAEAQLHGLMSQINPHFLFNSLNSVRALVIEDPAKAQTAVTALSELMRYSLNASQSATVPLETEIDMVRTYLSLQEVRLDERLTSQIDIAADTRGVQVPTMLVQELVENGVKHGIERLPGGGSIGVASWLDDDMLRVRVTNTGKITACDGSTRVGLANARERLRLLYGARASLALREDGRSVVAELVVPRALGAA
jgi:two-component system, LytTR family, sensor histidine kinase AlgZ